MIEIIDKHKARFRVSVGSGKDRKRYTKTVTYNSKKELKKLHQLYEAECRKSPLTDITVNQLIKDYIDNAELLGAKATTIKGYRSCAKGIYSLVDGILAKNCTTYRLEEIIAEMARNGRSPKTIKNNVSLISAAYKRGIKLGMLEDNPCSRVSIPRQRHAEKPIFTYEEAVRFTMALQEERSDYKVAFYLAMFCGLRRSEILGLRERDVSVGNSTLIVRETRHRIVGEEDIIQDTKAKASHRTLAVPEFVMAEIASLMAEHQENPYNQTDYLVQNGFGEPMSPSTLTKYITKVEDRCGLPHVPLHNLRHTFASMLNAERIDIARISRELGHSNIGTTLNIYTHIFNSVSDSSKSIAEMINSKFSEAIETSNCGNIENSATKLPQFENEKA